MSKNKDRNRRPPRIVGMDGTPLSTGNNNGDDNDDGDGSQDLSINVSIDGQHLVLTFDKVLGTSVLRLPADFVTKVFVGLLEKNIFNLQFAFSYIMQREAIEIQQNQMKQASEELGKAKEGLEEVAETIEENLENGGDKDNGSDTERSN